MTELAIFASTFVTVFALGIQSLNVNQGHYRAAFLTSFAIGGSSLVLYKMVPDANVTQCIAYLLGGATGITSGMWAHARLRRMNPLWKSKDQARSDPTHEEILKGPQ